jgi:hypothetical protein
MDELYITKIKNMSFKELKHELKNTHGFKNRELEIRKLMKQKYVRYLKYKNSIKNIDDIFENKIKTLNELDENYIKDEKFDVEIKRDSVNNNLMDRLNSDLYIKNIMKSTRQPNNIRNIHKPYEEINNNSSFVPFNNIGIIPNNDFSNTRNI